MTCVPPQAGSLLRRVGEFIARFIVLPSEDAALQEKLGLDNYFAEDPTTSPTARAATESDIQAIEWFISHAGLVASE